MTATKDRAREGDSTTRTKNERTMNTNSPTSAQCRNTSMSKQLSQNLDCASDLRTCHDDLAIHNILWAVVVLGGVSGWTSDGGSGGDGRVVGGCVG